MAAQNSPTAAVSAGYTTNEFQRGVAPVAPPRTSSNHRTSGAATSPTDRSRRVQTVDERVAASARMAGDGADGERGYGGRQTNGNERSKEDAASARSKRRQQQTTQDGIPAQGPPSNRESRSAAAPVVQSRSQPASITSTPNGPSREASAVLNRVVVTKAEVDIEREQARMAEAQSAGTGNNTPTAGLSVVGPEGVDDAGRGGGRSRQDHSNTSGKKEKNTRFGEYFLGNTLGEGEFGKVKMGWKQEGGVQVSCQPQYD
jgi:protein-serine/threonine kinase